MSGSSSLSAQSRGARACGRFAPALYVLGVLITGFGFLMLIPLAISWVTADGAHGAYDEAVLITILSGLLLSFSIGRQRREMRVRESFLLVALIWALLPAFGALPLYLHIDELTWTDAYFEAVSGLTATGATVLSGLDQLPLSINFWRTFMHWIGGLGVVVLAVAILPLLGFGGRGMLKAETPGPMKDSKITPRITETAKGLWVVYVILTIACGISLHYVGMEPWDAMMHAFSVMGLGGFSSKDASVGHFDSLDIELVVVFFALLAGINFSTHFLAFSQRSLRAYLSQRSLRAYLADVEAHYFLGILALSILALSLSEHPGAVALPVAGGDLSGLPDDSALRRFPLRVAGYFAWLCDDRLCSVAAVRATVDSLSGQFRRLLGFGRWRDQDDARGRSLQAGVTRTDARHASARPADRSLRRDGDSGPRAARDPRFHVHLRGQHRRDDAADGRHAAGHHHRLLRRSRLLEQHRPRTEPRRSGDDLRRAHRLSDLGVHLGHAARTSGDLHLAGLAHAGLLAALASRHPEPSPWRLPLPGASARFHAGSPRKPDFPVWCQFPVRIDINNRAGGSLGCFGIRSIDRKKNWRR